MLALVSANLIICISTIYPLFSTVQCHIEYAAPTLRETIESPLALVCSGPTPSVIQVSSEPSGGRKKLFFLAYIVCMREARPRLSMKKTPAWYRVPLSPPHTHTSVWSMNETHPSNEHYPLFWLTDPPTRCHVAQPVWLKRWIINRQICVSRFCWLSVHRCQTESFCFQSGVCPQWVFFPERHTKLQEWDFIKLPYLGRSLLLPLNYRIFSNQSR